LSNVFIGINLRLHQQKDDHLNPKIWKQLQIRELETHIFGSIYKIFAKILTQRIQVHLPFVIKPNQTGFVMGRNILDNNFLAQESFEWAIKNDQDLVLLLLNFKKAFDRIEWGFFL
jgi:hypothetical protein